ncbi:MAG: phage major capsid protein [Anaerolineae bacterium]
MTRTQIQLSLTTGSGREYEVVCIRPGRANGLEFSAAVLERSLPLWSGVTSFVDHAAAGPRAPHRSVRDVCGVIDQPRWVEARGIVARLHLTGAAGAELEPLLSALVQDREAGRPVPNVGLSADLLVAHDGASVHAIERVLAVDVVVNPAAGGRIERVLQGVPEEGQALCRSPKPEGGALPSAPMHAAPLPAPKGEENMSENTATNSPEWSALQQELAEAKEARRELTAACLRAALSNSGLPAPMQEAVRLRLSQRGDYTVAEALGEVEAERQVWAGLQEEQTVRGLGARVGAVRDGLDRLQLACERLFGLPLSGAEADVPRLTGLRELYLLLTGDQELRGVFVPERVSLANVTSSTLTSVVKNALNKVLVRAYESRPQWWAPIVVQEDFPTLKDVTWITLGGFGDLATVAEGDAYSELANLTDAEEVSSWNKKGGFIGITLETIDRDDVAAVRQIPRRLGLAAWRTLSASIAALFTANGGVGPYWPSSQSTYRLFDAHYANLGASALDAAAWDATVQAMYKQAEAGSGKRLGVRPQWLLVPIELEKTALTILKSAQEPGSGDNDANVRAGTFGVITVPEFTDAGNWAAAADPADLPGICVGYRFGRVPELFVADEATVGSMFTNDELRIKVRFLYTVGVADARALYKHNVT